MAQTSDTKARIDFGNNYGDVALDLPPDWSRSRMAGDQKFLLTTVGHEAGVPDVYAKDKPKQRYQFLWLNPKYQAEVSVARTKHYEPVTKTGWEKNPDLWEFDGEGYLVYNGDRLYARDEVYYVDDKEQRDKATARRDAKTAGSPEEEQLLKRLIARGAIIEDDRGRPLVPLSQKDK